MAINKDQEEKVRIKLLLFFPACREHLFSFQLQERDAVFILIRNVVDVEWNIIYWRNYIHDMGLLKSRTITVSINKPLDLVFESILNWSASMSPNAKKQDDGSWSFTTPRGPAKMRFHENKEFGILDQEFVDDEIRWQVPMHVVQNGSLLK